MFKQNKVKIISTSLIIFVPMLIGLILWDKLPDTIAVHFNADNMANGWESKTFVVFVMPLILLALHIICIAVTFVDPKYKNIGKKTIGIVYWIVPAVSIFMCVTVYAYALNIKVNVGTVGNIFVGALLIILGNVLPKSKQNYSFGIKTPWALNDSDNWKKSNHLGAWCMVIGGVVILINSFLGIMWVTVTVVLIVAIVPIIYSFLIYCRKNTEDMK